MHRSNRVLLAVVALAVAADGCSQSQPPPYRGPIRGTVTLDGKPLAKGNVRFIALDPTGINVLAPVADGAYDVPEGRGLVKGKYRVEFSVSKLGPPFRNPDFPDKMVQEPVETLPPRYHRDSQYLLDYDPNDPKPFDVALTSR
jgi:hypothetical protein